MPRRQLMGAAVAAVAVIAALWVAGGMVASGGFPADRTGEEILSQLMVMWAIPVLPWSLAAVLLIRALPVPAAVPAGTDLPGRLLAAVVPALPPDRAGWGAAMTAELAGVRGRAERWWFALGCARVMLAPPGLRAARTVPLVAAVIAVGLGAGVVVKSRLVLGDERAMNNGIAEYLLLGPLLVLLVSSALVALAFGSLRAGVRAAVWAAVLGSVTVFAAGLAEARTWARTESRLIFDGETVMDRSDPYGGDLDGFVLGLFLLPAWWLPFGLIGAVVGATVWRQLTAFRKAVRSRARASAGRRSAAGRSDRLSMVRRS